MPIIWRYGRCQLDQNTLSRTEAKEEEEEEEDRASKYQGKMDLKLNVKNILKKLKLSELELKRKEAAIYHAVHLLPPQNTALY